MLWAGPNFKGGLNERGESADLVFVPEPAIVGEFGPVVPKVTHFGNSLVGGEMRIFNAEEGDDDTGAVMTGGAVDEDIAFGGVLGEELVDGLEGLEGLLGGHGFKGVGAGVGEWGGEVLDASRYGGGFFKMDPGGFVLVVRGVGVFE